MEEGIVLSHKLHYGQHLILQGEGIVLAQPDVGLVSLQLGSHHLGSSDLALGLGAGVVREIIFDGDVTRIVAGRFLEQTKTRSKPI